MKSIIQDDPNVCWLCGLPANYLTERGTFDLDPLEWHHVWGGKANRPISEKYGLKVRLHGSKCHRNGRYSVHKNGNVRKRLQAIVQAKAMEHYGWTMEDWMAIFGKNYK